MEASAAPALSPGLRERKKDATRRALAERALELAIARGYHGFTIADVVDDVGVSRRTFSNYFSGKAECLAAVADGWLDDAMAGIAEHPVPTDLLVVLQDGLLAFAREGAQRWASLLPFAQNEPDVQAHLLAGDTTLVERIATEISNRSPLSADDLRVRLFASFTVTAGRACLFRWLADDRRETADLAAMLESAFSLINIAALAGVTDGGQTGVTDGGHVGAGAAPTPRTAGTSPAS